MNEAKLKWLLHTAVAVVSLVSVLQTGRKRGWI
jgi:hypothetical protein